jgi:hypothetical protein
MKLSKEDYDTLKRALGMFERLTGDKTSQILALASVANPEEDKKAEAARKDAAYKRQAELTALHEDAEQKLRQSRETRTADEVQPGNPGPGQGALATERAEEAGHRKGEAGKDAHIK